MSTTTVSLDRLPAVGEKATLDKPLLAYLLYNDEDDDPQELDAGAVVMIEDYGATGPLGAPVFLTCGEQNYCAEEADILEALAPDWRERRALADAISNPNQQRLDLGTAKSEGTVPQ